eukprot:symbB.v1.2.004085.t1/scaffold200.1/size464218/15
MENGKLRAQRLRFLALPPMPGGPILAAPRAMPAMPALPAPAAPRQPSAPSGRDPGFSQGRIRSFYPSKGYGFIEANGQPDLFFLPSSLPKELVESKQPLEGMEITFEAYTNEEGKARARNIQPFLPPPPRSNPPPHLTRGPPPPPVHMKSYSKPQVMAPRDTREVQTLIFVDVDGVLNVGIHDEGKAPLLLRDEDVQTAIKLAKRGYKGPEASCVEKLSSLATAQVGFNENDTYEKLMTRQGGEVADILVQRLAQVIESAGDCQVILSSSWRRPHHRNRRRALENRIAHFLGKPFRFHSATPMYREERTATDRLETVGDYVVDFCRDNKEKFSSLRVLMLEDFFITPMNGWKSRNQRVSSIACAERILLDDAKSYLPATDVSVKICHCYSEVTCGNLTMQVGTGLTQRLFDEAKSFVSTSISPRSTDPETPVLLPPILPKVIEKKVEEPAGFVSSVISAFVPPIGSMVHAF